MGFYSWIDNSGLGKDKSLTIGVKEEWVYGILIC